MFFRLFFFFSFGNLTPIISHIYYGFAMRYISICIVFLHDEAVCHVEDNGDQGVMMSSDIQSDYLRTSQIPVHFVHMAG